MSTEHTLGPDDAQLTVHTGRAGAAAKAGHDLTIDVTGFTATVTHGEDPAQTRLVLQVDPSSLRVLEGRGGMNKLGEDDKAGIRQTIDDEVLKGQPIEFRSTSVTPGDDGELQVQGDLTLSQSTKPVTFALKLADDGQLRAQTTIKQSDWGMKPYSALFGTLKVADEVRIEITGKLPSP